MLRTVSKWLLTMAVPGALLGGCGVMQDVSDSTRSTMHSIFYKQVKVLRLDLSARSALNTQSQEMSMLSVATMVRIYQLRDRQSVESATYQQLLDESRSTLAEDLLDEQQVIVRPGEGVQLNVPMASDAQYVAVVGLFRSTSAESDVWRLVIARDELDPDMARRIDLGDNLLQLQPMTDQGWW